MLKPNTYIGPFTVRSSAILTGSYVTGTVIGPGNGAIDQMNQLMLHVDFTKGSLTSAEIKVEFSDDGTNYYQETFSQDTFASNKTTEALFIHELDTTGAYRIAIPIKDKYIKISSKGTGTVTNSLLAITAIVGQV